MLSIVKIFEFAYGHHLPGYHGKCMNPHGHTGILQVEIAEPGPGDNCSFTAPDGMIIDFSELKSIIHDIVIEKMDHHYLNDFLEMPTAENMTRWVVEQLRERFGKHLIRVRIYETPSSYAEWKRG